MGNCCPTDNTDPNPVATAATTSKNPSTSPNARTRQKKEQEVNPFKPGARGVAVVQNEDGKLQKVKVKPPANPYEQKDDGQAQSLVTHSLLTAQRNDPSTSKKLQEDVYQGASF